MLRLSNNRFQGQLPDLQLGEVGYVDPNPVCFKMAAYPPDIGHTTLQTTYTVLLSSSKRLIPRVGPQPKTFYHTNQARDHV
jgi:hypothetical protein